MKLWNFITVLILGAFLFTNVSSHANTSHLYDGLDYCLPLNIAQKDIFIPYEVLFSGPDALPPIFGKFQMEQNGRTLSWGDDRDIIRDTIRDAFLPGRHGLFVPPEKGITVTSNNNKPVWNFPDGTAFVHEIDLNRKLFEVRILKHIGTRWAFGAYTPTSEGACAQNLKLRVDADDPRYLAGDLDSRELNLIDAKHGQIKVRYQPMAPELCWSCHSMPDGNRSPHNVGPCHFEDERFDTTPFLRANSSAWIDQFQKRFGHSPFHQ